VEDTAPIGVSASADEGGQSPPRRFWSPRRLPAAVTAAVALIAAGALLYDIIAVRAGGSAATWRRRLADELATRPVDDVWVLIGAAVAAALGLWLVVLALTPGLRQLLPLRAPDSSCRVRAALDRDSAAMVLRDAAMRVPGVSRARVHVRRHRIKAQADARFRDPQEVERELSEVLREERDQLCLAHPPGLAVRVRRRRT
jgi:hypothetical protein